MTAVPDDGGGGTLALPIDAADHGLTGFTVCTESPCRCTARAASTGPTIGVSTTGPASTSRGVGVGAKDACVDGEEEDTDGDAGRSHADARHTHRGPSRTNRKAVNLADDVLWTNREAHGTRVPGPSE